MKIIKRLAFISTAITTASVVMKIHKKNETAKVENMKLKLPAKCTVTAHTGALNTPDNSAESLIAGAECGADIIEFDLNFNNDGEAVLSHNTPVGGELTLDEAFAILEKYPNVKVNIDVKTTAKLELIPEAAAAHNMTDRIFYTGIGASFVPAVKEKTPDMIYYLNKALSPLRTEEYFAELEKEVKDLGAIGLNINKEFASKPLIDYMHAHGLEVSVWTVDKTDEMLKYLMMGADNITSQKPDELLKIKKSINQA